MTKNMTYAMFISILLLTLIHMIVGYIPVNNGEGWDGSANYMPLIKSFGYSADPAYTNPYSAIRAYSSFIPIIILTKMGLYVDLILKSQMIINIISISCGIAFLWDVLEKLKVTFSVSVFSISMFFLSVSVCFVPVFNPILTDHWSILVSCLCLFCWGRNYILVLLVICVYSVWVMPGLFLIPLILVAIPFKNNEPYYGRNKISLKIEWIIYLFIIIVSFILLYIYKVDFFKFLDAHNFLYGERLFNKLIEFDSIWGFNDETFEIHLYSISIWATFFLLFLLTRSWVSILFYTHFWKSINWIYLLIGFSCVFIGFFFAIYHIGWRFEHGPPLFSQFMAIESAAAPFKTLVAHFCYFGPVFILAIYNCISESFRLRNNRHINISLIAIVYAYLPLILFLSESRQFVYLLPVIILVFSMKKYNSKQYLLFIVISVVILYPIYYMGIYNLNSFSSFYKFNGSPNLALIYLHQNGPWMTIYLYRKMALLIILFLILLNLLDKKIRCIINNAVIKISHTFLRLLGNLFYRS